MCFVICLAAGENQRLPQRRGRFQGADEGVGRISNSLTKAKCFGSGDKDCLTRSNNLGKAQVAIPSLGELQRSMTRSKSESDIVGADRESSLQMPGEEWHAVNHMLQYPVILGGIASFTAVYIFSILIFKAGSTL